MANLPLFSSSASPTQQTTASFPFSSSERISYCLRSNPRTIPQHQHHYFRTLQHYKFSYARLFSISYCLLSYRSISLYPTPFFLSPYIKSSKWVVEVTTKRLSLLHSQRFTQQSSIATESGSTGTTLSRTSDYSYHNILSTTTSIPCLSAARQQPCRQEQTMMAEGEQIYTTSP